MTLNALYRVENILENARGQFLLAVQGQKFDVTAINEIYKTSELDELKKEFSENIYSNSDSPDKLKNYINKIYYGSIVKYRCQLHDLMVKYSEIHNKDYIKLADDDTFTKLYNGYISTLSSIADDIFYEANLLGIALKNWHDVKATDYDLRGRYIVSERNDTISIEIVEKNNTPELQVAATPSSEWDDFSYPEIALLHFYKQEAGMAIRLEHHNKEEIAAMYSKVEPSSGLLLYRKMLDIQDPHNRYKFSKGSKNKYMKMRLEKILPLLEDTAAYESAKDEYDNLMESSINGKFVTS